MQKIFIFSMLVILSMPCVSSELDKKYGKAVIYYYGWDVMTRLKLSQDDVRSNYKIMTLISDTGEISALVRYLKLENLKQASKEIVANGEDPRLVIDLYYGNDGIDTYYASKFNLLSGDNSQIRSIDQEFKKKFTFYEH
jgi:hypothetical protein